MRAKYLGKTEVLVLTSGKVYEVLSVERDWYRIVDDSGEDYLYPPAALVLDALFVQPIPNFPHGLAIVVPLEGFCHKGYFCKEFPCPVNCFVFKIVSK